MSNRPENAIDFQKGRLLMLGAVLLYGFTSRLYLVLRYAGFSVLGDGAFFTRASDSVISTGSVNSQILYPAGFGYQTIVAFISELTGVSSLTIQLYVAPFFGMLPLLGAYALFRNLLGKTRSAFVALVVLAIIPDFLTVTSRSTHEAFTVALIVVLFLVLNKIMFDPSPKPSKLVWILLWWILFMGILTLNIVFAYVAMILSASLVLVIEFGLRHLNMTGLLSRRSWWSFVVTSLALTFFYAWYIYPSAASGLVQLNRNLIFVSELLTPDQVTAYQFVQSTWRSFWIYLGLTLSLWTVLLVSGVEWIRRVRLLLFHKASERPPVLFMIGALAILGIALLLSVAADFVTKLGNAQYRMLPLVLLVSTPLAVLALGRRMPTRLKKRRALAAVVIVGLVVLSSGSLVKATTDPAASKFWSFFSPDELAAVRWTHNHLRGQTIWADVDSRILRLSWMYTSGPDLYDVTYVDGLQELANQRYCYLMDSAVVEHRVLDYGQILRVPNDANLLYQNGRTQVWGLCT